MKVCRHMHVIAVRDLEASAAYYKKVLGFTVSEIGDPGWRLFTLDACRIMAGECPDALQETGDHSYFAYIVLDDVKSYHASLKNASFIKELRDEPWGMREFGVKTIDGHRIMFGQDI